MWSFNPKKWFSGSLDESVRIETKGASIDLANDSFLAHVFGAGSNVGPAQAASFYSNTAAVATAVDMIAESIEQIKPVLQTPDGKFIDKHEIIDLFKRPNGFDTWQNFIGSIARNYLLNHDSILSASGNTSYPPLELWSVMMQTVSISEDLDTYPQSYNITRGPITGNFNRYDKKRSIGAKFYDGRLKELFHIKGYSSGASQITGNSPLEAAANEARQIIEGKTHNLQLLRNGGRLSLMIAFNDEDEINDDEHRKRIQRLNEQYSGSSNAGKIGVLSNADVSEIKEFGINNKDMDFGNLETLAAQAIYLRYKIPLALVSLKASTFNNLQTGIELFYDQAVLPALDIIFAGLSEFLLHRYKLDPTNIRITYNPENIRQLKARQLEEVAQRRKIGVETINELRSLLPKRDDLPEEVGDVLPDKKADTREAEDDRGNTEDNGNS